MDDRGWSSLPVHCGFLPARMRPNSVSPAVEPVPRDSFQGSTARMIRIFAAIERQGGLSIASLPEYWRNHWEDLGAFVLGGVDGFEIVNCAPKALGFPSDLRRQVLTLAASHDLLVVGASDNHGWGQVTCVWNVSLPGAHRQNTGSNPERDCTI